MVRTIKVKYESRCRKCGKTLPIGSTARWSKGRGVWCLNGCPSYEADLDAEIDLECRERIRMDSEYAKGVAEAERYLSDKAIYGEELAEQWAYEDDFNRYWKYGEDY